MKLKLLTASLFITAFVNAQNVWTQKANFTGAARHFAVAFSIGTKGYLGTGLSYGPPVTLHKDFWEYNPVTDVWTQKADFGGNPKDLAVGFSIGTKGYIGTGYESTTVVATNDFWEYNQGNNTWTAKANFGGAPRKYATGFSVGNKGYIGLGNAATGVKKDFWEFNPVNNTWTQKANYAGNIRTYAVGFGIGTKGYIGTGVDSAYVESNQFWQYNPANDTWTQKANFGGVPRYNAVGFSTSNSGFIGTGQYNFGTTQDFWEYNPTTDVWTQRTNFGGGLIWAATGFSISNKGYIGTGLVSALDYQGFWEYSTLSGVESINNGLAIDIFPNPVTSSFTLSLSPVLSSDIKVELYNLSGEKLQMLQKFKEDNMNELTFDVSILPSGIYYLKVEAKEGSSVRKFVKF